ncbi:probable KEM1 - multifunctional nuclease [Cephalotrichum gorgonifer]|uniref:5'-3' exoribonuclease 1 n=1 Tax=Cephalotrichum gorgonifer TaxID=2041049 RepID=A0AAE8SRZ4_9PEZI|nr:probable KEM1 - multifunctional nuclease [Cephalotrichum gorgonifer]
MGVPKFFRWISERYPGISQLIAENRIPEFDCLYLDMNGIIHNCTHKDAGEDVSFRLSEEEMFIRIFNYIEHLFGKIKPKQVFYMAIDGVAPRAKMNQQRARRFRTALEVEQAQEKAIKEGVELPKEPPFDSNCITPGTAFMAKLSHQLKYFINKKVSEDTDWQQCEVILSGHEVPGEGEHKIMEYIRNAKAQPDYSPDIRHCLYGLDADLIMLGLLSHDPHFCLLREEVTFGRASKTKSKELEHQNFYLLHLCIVREYLELEFQELKADGALSFPFDLENVIDDFILMAFFVGNDFLPNLPWLHINEGALAHMFGLYKKVLPQCEGYLNERGVINLPRLQVLLNELSRSEADHFEDEVSNEKWFQAKKMEDDLGNLGTKKKTSKGQLVITSSQKELWKKKIKPFISNRSSKQLDLGSGLNAEDRHFVTTLAETLRLQWSTQEDDDGKRNLVIQFPAKSSDAEDEEDDDDEEANVAVFRVVKQYDRAMVVDVSSELAQANYEKTYQDKYKAWKAKYYLQKFEWPLESYDTELVKLCENYVEGLQWVLYYYYRGIASWPWFYRYHYSPLTSDVVKGLGANLNFKKGVPFKPYEQLMGVLPDRSKSIVPKVYWDLMTDPNSPIFDFYPRDFELDMNGKKMDWEAVVKIPFIDEARLLAAMEPKNKLLSKDEDDRNQFGVALKFTYSADVNFVYPSSMVGVFPDLPSCHCVENIFDMPDTEGLEYRPGLVEGAKLNDEALAGFPTLHTLPYEGALVSGYGINVFQSESRNPSMIITLLDSEARANVEYGKQRLGQKCFVGYPFLQEAKIIKVSDSHFNYELGPDGKSVIQTNRTPKEIDEFAKEANYIENWHARRLGITIGTVECLVYVHMLKGLVKTEAGALIKEYGENPSLRSIYSTQTIVDDVINQDERFIEKAAVPIEEEFPIGTQGFFLGEYGFGRPLVVTGHSNNKAEINLSVQRHKEPDFAKQIIHEASLSNRYVPSYAVAKRLGIDALVLSKITSSYQVNTIGGLKVNLGLNLKFAGKGQKVLGYSQKSSSGWEFSNTAIQLIANFMVTFPDFFAAMHRVAVRSDVSETDLWPDEKAPGTRIKEIGAWLKQQGVNKLERVPLEAEQLDSEVVGGLAAVGEKALDLAKDPIMKAMKGVPRTAILKPSDIELLLNNQKFALGDRVTYVSAAGKVPLGIRGTVVGISRTATALLLDIVWDQTFMSGNTLGGRTPPFRGQTVSASSVLNTSNKQVVSGSKAALGRNSVKPVPALTTSSEATTGMPQYRDAPPPGPLRGTWRGAVNGRGRGRGQQHGQNNLAYRPHPGNSPSPHQGPPQQQGGHAPRGGPSRGANGGGRGRGGRPNVGPQGTDGASPSVTPAGEGQYARVPPPASLNATGGQHGRGRGRGRGGPRGRASPRGGRGGVPNGSPAA